MLDPQGQSAKGVAQTLSLSGKYCRPFWIVGRDLKFVFGHAGSATFRFRSRIGNSASRLCGIRLVRSVMGKSTHGVCGTGSTHVSPRLFLLRMTLNALKHRDVAEIDGVL